MKSKKLGLSSGIAVCVGLIVATSCLVSLGIGIGLAGRWFILPLFVVMFLNMFVALSFSELHSMMPDVDGGTGQYLLVGLGPLPSMVGNISAYIITMVLASTAELVMCGTVLQQLFFPAVDSRVIAMLVLCVFFAINCFGVNIFSKIQNIVVVLLIGSMVILGVLGTFGLGTGTMISAEEQTAPAIQGIGNVMSLAAIAFWLFIGVEFVIPVAKNMKNPKRDVLLSMVLGLILLFGVQAVLGWGMSNYVSLDILAADPNGTPHMTYAYNLLGKPGQYWMGFVTILAAVSTMNTVFVSTSKIMEGMAQEGLLPKVFTRTNRYNSAYIGLAFLAFCDSGLILTNLANAGGIVFLILAASCFWLVTYCMIHLSVLLMRRRYPNAPRNAKLTFYGIPQILGILGNVYMIWHIESGDARTKIFVVFGVLFAVLVAYSAIWVMGVMKVKAFRPVELELVRKGNGFMPTVLESQSREKPKLSSALF